MGLLSWLTTEGKVVKAREYEGHGPGCREGGPIIDSLIYETHLDTNRSSSIAIKIFLTRIPSPRQARTRERSEQAGKNKSACAETAHRL